MGEGQVRSCIGKGRSGSDINRVIVYELLKKY